MLRLEDALWKLEKYEDELLTNTILYNQLPLKNPNEQKNFLINRLKEMNLPNIREDDEGNVYVSFVNDDTSSTALIFTTVDEIRDPLIERFARVLKGKIEGLKIVSSSLNVAALLTMIKFLHSEKVDLRKNVIFLFLNQARKNKFLSLGEFLQENMKSLDYAIKVNGINLGDLGHRSLGKYVYKLKFYSRDSIHKTSKSPSTLEILYRITSNLKENADMEGTSASILKLDKFEDNTEVILEIKSEGDQDLETISENLRSTVTELAERYNLKIKLNLLSYIPTTFIPKDHPLIEQIRDVHNHLKIKTKLVPLDKDEALIIKSGIPAVSLGIAKGEILDGIEYFERDGVMKGLNQILMVVDNVTTENFAEEEIDQDIIGEEKD
ncbi:hypothetical protein HWHPT5561_00180 [Petrotoga sp. HWH.PT.55.6.1]|uniref:hypothetical protein n=1 Tax=unclassified Petrotoga TaxID=2620614 RepID=UPI000CA00CF6|nr:MULTISPECIES: hypothetical protein [unclassified Petrotoga]PNR93328.1 hypothetical protein X926_03485 [Petrotoga sp. HWHPT.55.6.3]RPD36693.1 hypothetical protein HWHPT5561_00180 [Petrotoga sp. HWH.PT.55.6.1]